MINNVPIKIMQASRIVALRHPNSLDCIVYRKMILADSTGDDMGGLPTLGGLGVLKSEDEPDFEYVKLGEGKLHITSRFEGGSLFDRGDGIASDEPMQEAQIEPVVLGEFEVKSGDLVAATPGGGVLIGFEVIGKPSTVSIYPYASKWVIAPRDELHDLAPWTP
jgi:hypothetical protein